jgi:hypothetical protein
MKQEAHTTNHLLSHLCSSLLRQQDPQVPSWRRFEHLLRQVSSVCKFGCMGGCICSFGIASTFEQSKISVHPTINHVCLHLCVRLCLHARARLCTQTVSPPAISDREPEPVVLILDNINKEERDEIKRIVLAVHGRVRAIVSPDTSSLHQDDHFAYAGTCLPHMRCEP